jgi:hypothetical protein
MLELQKIIHDVTDPVVVLRRVVEQALHAVPHADGAAVELGIHLGQGYLLGKPGPPSTILRAASRRRIALGKAS